MAFLSTLLFGNKKCQTELQMFLVEHDNVLFLKMHSILVQASSTLFGGRYVCTIIVHYCCGDTCFQRLLMNQFREMPVDKVSTIFKYMLMFLLAT